MDYKVELGKQLSSLRKELGLTQKELAEKLEISVVYISYLEMAKKTPSPQLLEKLYKLSGETEVPAKIKRLLSEAKKQARKELTDSKLSRIIRETSETDPNNLFDTLEALIEKDRREDAKVYILKYLAKNSDKAKPSEKKLLEALYYILQDNLSIAIKLIRDVIEN